MTSLSNINTGIDLSATGLITGTAIANVNSMINFFISPTCFFSDIILLDVGNYAYTLPINPIIGKIYCVRNDDTSGTGQNIFLFPGSSNSYIIGEIGSFGAGNAVEIPVNSYVNLIAVSSNGLKNNQSGANPFNNPLIVWQTADDDIITPNFNRLQGFFYEAASAAPQTITNVDVPVVFGTVIHNQIPNNLTVTTNSKFQNTNGARMWIVSACVYFEDNGTGAQQFEIYIRVNGGTTWYSTNEGDNNADDFDEAYSIQSPILMSNNDYIEIMVNANNVGATIIGGTSGIYYPSVTELSRINIYTNYP